MKNLLLLIFLITTTIGYGQIFDEGIVTGPMTTVEINAIVGPQEGRQVYNSTTQTIWLWDGTQWVDTFTGGVGGDFLLRDGTLPMTGALTTQNILPDAANSRNIGSIPAPYSNIYYDGQVRADGNGATNDGYTSLTSGGLYIQSSNDVNTWSITNREGIAKDGRLAIRPFSNWTADLLEYDYIENRWEINESPIATGGILADYIPLTGSSAITGTLSPSVSGTYSLGSGTNRWANLDVETANLNNATFTPTDVEPSGVKGKIYFDDSEETLKQYTGAVWQAIGSGAGGTDDQIASEVPFTPAGDIQATDVQAAIEEVDDEKVGTNPLSPVQNLDSWMGTKAEFLIDDPVTAGVKLIYITDSLPSTPTGTVLEGVNVLSTGEVTTKVLTTDGDGTSSWQVAAGGGDAFLANTQTFTGVNTFSVADNLFFNAIKIQGEGTNNTSIVKFVDNALPTTIKGNIGYSGAGAPGMQINNSVSGDSMLLLDSGAYINTALNGTGTEMLVADANGAFSRQPIPTGTGDALVADPLSQFASTTSAQLAGVISNETGTGALVFGTSPVLASPTLGIATATTINGVTLTSGSINGTVTGTNTGDQSSIVGITGNTSQFNTALTGDNFAFLSASQSFSGTNTHTSGSTVMNDNVKLEFGTLGAEAELYSDGTNLRLDLKSGSRFNIYDVPEVNPVVGWESANNIWFTSGSMTAGNGLTTDDLINWNDNDTNFADDAIAVFSNATQTNSPAADVSVIMKSHAAGNVNNSWAISKKHGNNQDFYLSDHGSGSWRHAPILVQESGTFSPGVIGTGNLVAYTANANASYVKQGNMCTFSILLSSVSGTTPTGTLRITDLPFLADALSLCTVEMTGGSVNLYSVHGKIFDSGDYIQLYYQSSLDGSNNSPMSDVDFGSGLITVTGTYITQ